VSKAGGTFTAFLIAGEESGDQLGSRLMQAMSERLGGNIRFVGVGGDRMAKLGFTSLFPMEEIALHGFTAIIANLGRILWRMRWTARRVVEADPDVLVIIDCPGFNLGVARRVRKARPSIPIVEYVSPTVWVWRPRRARWIGGFVDHILALLPFEPAVHQRLGGPPCSYVGHPLIERLATLRPAAGERSSLTDGAAPVLLVLPGSRRGEIDRLTEAFGETVALVAERYGRPMEVLLPAVPRFADELRARVAAWRVKPTVIAGDAEKFAAFRRAHAALAASGTVTLELAFARVPMVVAYRLDLLAKPFKWARSRINSFVLPNLILGTNEIPEFLDAESATGNLADALLPLLGETPERARQLTAFDLLETTMARPVAPSVLAAEIVLRTAGWNSSPAK
jgi:lipid-A-disaccharide synthase